MVATSTQKKKTMRGQVAPAFFEKPENLVLVRDKKHPLYVEDVNKPLDEEMVASIMMFGVIEAIECRKNGHQYEVVNGRQRVKAAIEANKRLVEQGRPPVKIKFTIYDGEDKHIAGAVIAANEIGRRPDVVLIKAAKAQRLLNLGYTHAEVGVTFGVTAETIENWVKLCGLHRDVRALVARGKVKYTVAMRLAALPREEQMPKIRELLRTKASNANAVRAVIGGKLEKVQPPTRQHLRRIADALLHQRDFLASDKSSDVFSFVSWVLGRISTDELLSCLSTSDGGAIGETVRSVMLPKGG